MSDVDYQVVDGLHIFVIETSKTLKLLQTGLDNQNLALRELCLALKSMNTKLARITNKLGIEDERIISN